MIDKKLLPVIAFMVIFHCSGRAVNHAPEILSEEGIERFSSFPITELDSSNFDDLVKVSGRVAMVDFYSPACPACTKMKPVVHSLSEKYSNGEVLIGKINTDEDNTIWPLYYIDALPTFVFFRDGEEYLRLEGNVPEDLLREAIRVGLEEEM